jgi:sec-independent protein translocase protein TatB
MFNVGGGEIMVILLLALLVLGPDKLPEYTRKAGRYINEFRRMTSGFQEEFRSAIDLGDVLSPSPEKPAEAPASKVVDDALDRTTEGPRLLPQAPGPASVIQPEPEVPAASVESAPTPMSEAPVPAPAPAEQPAAVDRTPAAGSGPELITPSRPPVDHHGDTGSSSAA